MERPALDAPTTEWLVYADALQVAGDPRGELIALAPVADARVRDTFVHKHADALLGPAAKAYRKGALRLVWHHCFITSAEVRIHRHDRSASGADHGERWIRTLLALPDLEHLTQLTITGVTDDEKPVDLAPAIAAVTRAPWPPSLASLALVDERATRSQTQIAREVHDDENLVDFGPLEAVWRIPQLRHLVLELADATRVDFGAIDGTGLESLAIRALRACTGTNQIPYLPALAETAWPRLESLELRLAESFFANIPRERRPYRPSIYADMEAEPDDGSAPNFDFGVLVPLLRRLASSPLRRLALTSFDSATSLLVALEAGLPDSLRVLDLSDSAIRTGDLQWMREHPSVFAHLGELRLERTAVDDSRVRELRGLAPAIVHSHRADAPTYRYVVGME
jgi:hypothetical protein